MEHPILAQYPGNINDINWKYLDKDTYIEIENMFTNNVVFFNPFKVDNFFPPDMFAELVEFCTSISLPDTDYSYQMNKWEQNIGVPSKFIDYAVDKIRQLIGTDDVEYGYHMYAHHQIDQDNRIPKLPLHIDIAPGSYMIDLHIGGNRNWEFVAGYNRFTCEPNQAIVCQPEFDFHYRPPWNSQNKKEYYQVLFFHLVHKNHWKNLHGWEYRETEKFQLFQQQRQEIFNKPYVKKVCSIIESGKLPEIPWDQIPNETENDIHDKKGYRVS